ncbi:hypothetical protein KSD_78060 [Ktedonobacter sp. SOSP1-85]|nr:hypothetical protein KSD_78060 [Ktedonobacter sp. SOSP1-85]
MLFLFLFFRHEEKAEGHRSPAVHLTMKLVEEYNDPDGFLDFLFFPKSAN